MGQKDVTLSFEPRGVVCIPLHSLQHTTQRQAKGAQRDMYPFLLPDFEKKPGVKTESRGTFIRE